MEKRISIVIPVYNKSDDLDKCLRAAFASKYKNFEVIVVDDCSEDNSAEIAGRYPCRLISLDKKSGTSKARNTGALNSDGEILFFIDADCLLLPDTLAIINRSYTFENNCVVMGGTYTKIPYDNRFFSTFQSVFVHYFETRMKDVPDYIAAHAMVMDAAAFRDSNGFPEKFLPIIEDVEFTHRLRRAGCRLVMNPEIQVQHIFNFSFLRSLTNAFRKTAYWCIYSLGNRDFLTDSGTASHELKTNVAVYCMNVFILASGFYLQKWALLYAAVFLLAVNIYVSRGFLRSFFEAKGGLFGVLASLYYIFIYPVPVGMGTFYGTVKYALRSLNKT